MIGRIRRILTQPVQTERDWSLDEPLEFKEVESGFAEDTNIEAHSTPPEPPRIGAMNENGEYYAAFIQSCINSGGRFGDNTISVRWLRMILAGLKGVELGPEEAWDLDEQATGRTGTGAEERLYMDLFREKLTI